MKTCFKCNESKDEEEFYRHPQMGDGRLGKCKVCTRADVEKNRQDKIDYYRMYDRERGDLPHRIAARAAYAKTAQGREALCRGKNAWCARNPRKKAAQWFFNNRKRIDPAFASRPCEVCGGFERVHAHHENYDEPLKVRWLCPKHHSERHKEMRRLGIVP
jgi:hypothetical protein